MIKLSVITVVYNNVDTISNTLQSVANQTHANIEHIVIDGGSTDGTLEILQSNQGLSILRSESDTGIYDAMNKGLALATGAAICFLNADDVYESSEILQIMAQVLEDNNLDAVFGDVVYFHPHNPEKIIRRYSSARFTPQALAYGWMPAHPSLLLRRTVFQVAGGFKVDYQIAGDFEFVARVFGEDKLNYSYLPKVIVKMQTGGASTSGWQSTFISNREVMRACKENGIKTNYLKVLSKYPRKLLEFININK